MKTLLTFCGVYHGNSPDIKGNLPYNFKHLIVGVSFHSHLLIRWCGFKSSISLQSGCLCKRIHSYIEAVQIWYQRLPLFLRYHKIYIYVFHSAFFFIVIVSVSINSILSIIIKHILLIIFCNDDRDKMLWGYWHVFLYVILFNCKMSMQVLFQIKFSQNRCLVTSWEHRHSLYWSTWWFDCVHSFPSVQFGVIS